MKKLLPIILISTNLLISCSKNNPKEQFANLSGYWEIKKVETPYGKKVEYKINESIDYINLKDSTGYRVKVLPRIDGKFTTNKDKEQIRVQIENDSLRMYYTTPYDEWMETVLKADGEELKVKNSLGAVYTYKKYQIINITD